MMATIEAETINPATVITRDEAAPVARSGNYEPVRFNAMKHGILSRLAVLAHEDHAEFADLLSALMDEHRPAGRMKPGTIKTGAMPATARDSARIGENDSANFPNDLGKSRREKIMGGFGSGRGQHGKDTTSDM